jgi:hypothetical protein
MAFDATLGGPAATSYATQAFAEDYFGDRLFVSAWENADEQQRRQALTQATAWLDKLAWEGMKATTAQRLAWPRAYAPTQEPSFADAFPTSAKLLDARARYYPETEIPLPILEATCELALALLGETADPSARDAAEGITREKVGPLETEYAAPLVRKQGLARFPAVWTRIQPLLRHAHGGTVTRG